MSVDAVHLRLTDVDVLAVYCRLVGAVGGIGSPVLSVFTLIVLLASDTLPAASLAFTVKLYVVSAVRFVTV
ncbi:hypothetical protein D3C76_1372090 [compost metagenome]